VRNPWELPDGIVSDQMPFLSPNLQFLIIIVPHCKLRLCITGYTVEVLILPAKAREYVFTGVGMSVCDHDN